MSIEASINAWSTELPPGTLGTGLVLSFLVAHSLLVLTARNRPADRGVLLLTNSGLACLFGALLLSGWAWPETRWLGTPRLWAPILFFWWVYKWMGPVLHIFHPPEFSFDPVLLRLDERWFGQPSRWWARGRRRWLTECLQAAYTTYYLYTPFMAALLSQGGRLIEFESFALAVMLGYAVCYLAYPLFPVWGPRWGLVQQGSLGTDEQQLSGYWLTRVLNHIMYKGVALKGGAMPSAHSSTGVVFLVWCFRLWGVAGGIPAAAVVIAMMAGAVYGRYHYVSDIAVGSLVGLGGLWGADQLLTPSSL